MKTRLLFTIVLMLGIFTNMLADVIVSDKCGDNVTYTASVVNQSEADNYVSRMQRSYNQIRKYEQQASSNPMSQISVANWIAHEFDDNFYPALRSLISLADKNSGTRFGDYCELQVKKWYNIGKLIAMNYNLRYAIFQ